MLKTQLECLIKVLRDYYVVFDIDGTLTRFRYTKSKQLLPCDNSDLEEFSSQGNNMYENAEPLISMQYIISRLNPDKVATLSTTTTMNKVYKSIWIKENYPTIKERNMLWTEDDFQKLEYLEKLAKEHKVLYVDDSYKTLLYIEKRNKDITLMHISEFML